MRMIYTVRRVSSQKTSPWITSIWAPQSHMEANRLLAGEKGHGHLQTSAETTHGEKLDSSSVGGRSGNSARFKPGNPRSLTILGLRQTAFPLKKTSFFSDKKEIQMFATALGYVSHAVSLISAYLDVLLRYPLRLGGSCSYINDYAPSVEPASLDSSPNLLRFTDLKPTEFPLFLEGQDTTSASYAVFLLNKIMERMDPVERRKWIYKRIAKKMTWRHLSSRRAMLVFIMRWMDVYRLRYKPI